MARQVRDVGPRSRVVLTRTICAKETVNLAGSPSYRVVVDDGTGELEVLLLGGACSPVS
jgi:hypothetical protein